MYKTALANLKEYNDQKYFSGTLILKVFYLYIWTLFYLTPIKFTSLLLHKIFH